MKVKGIELMQMIADGKIKEGTKMIILDRFCNGEDYFYFKGKCKIYDKDNKRYDEGKWTDYISLYDLTHHSFEILEDKTEEIEEIKVDDNYYIHTELGSFKGRKMDIAFVNKFNELTKIVNKLNKQDTSKETNCMTD